jgi:hypothetical protein
LGPLSPELLLGPQVLSSRSPLHGDVSWSAPDVPAANCFRQIPAW